MFGPHLVLEGYNCQATGELASEKSLIALLEKFPAKLNMNIIMPPQVMHYDGGEIPADKGISGFVIIAESHIAIHTFPEKGFFTLDIFSCMPFDEQAAIDFINGYFQPKSYEHKVFNRGREFPRSGGRAAQIINAERGQIKRVLAEV